MTKSFYKNILIQFYYHHRFWDHVPAKRLVYREQKKSGLSTTGMIKDAVGHVTGDKAEVIALMLGRV